ncbi:hypothetical protein [Hymenobacter weizhouensis]|uniref:hypothetical protein n=1 Tax=Hymenobacter sp. YIM 151500-1 TaxID=2987689 RepID=UPI00222715F4|nr:hypothetical protein [Hymenobacter sp. YIM 151500-1]UYZ63171.1 hypothetical protein OIS53_19535 [Hymenobacter sp. YIM 151500-1]
MKQIYFFLLCLLMPVLGLAQATTPRQPHRLELPLTHYSSDVYVQPLSEDSSVVLLVEKDPLFTGQAEFFFHKFDAQLQPGRRVPVPVPRGFDLQRVCAEGTDVYALFQNSGVPGTLWVAAFDSRTGELGGGEFQTKRVREIHDLKALGGNLFVTVALEQHLTVVLLNLKTAQFRFLPSVYEPLPATLNFLADSVTRRAEFVLSETNGFKSRLQLKQLSAQGQLLHSEFVQAESERGLLEAQLSPGDSAARLLAGTYTLRDSRYSQGLFATALPGEGSTTAAPHRALRFYDFLNLKHFFDFMKPERVARLRQRSERRRAAARQYRLRYRLLMHDLLPFEQGYVLAAEVYYPRYNYSNYGYNPFFYSGFGGLSPYGNAWSRYSGSMRNFDGYRTTHTVLCGFDKNGTLLWDNSFLLKDVQRYDLRETVSLRPLPDGRRLAVAYLHDNTLHYKIIDHAVAAPNDQQVDLLTTLTGAREKASSTQQEQLQPWYGSRFLASGYQHVRPDRGTGRDVFFLNVVAFD